MGVVDPTPEGGRIPGDGWHADHGCLKWWKTLKKQRDDVGKTHYFWKHPCDSLRTWLFFRVQNMGNLLISRGKSMEKPIGFSMPPRGRQRSRTPPRRRSPSPRRRSPSRRRRWDGRVELSTWCTFWRGGLAYFFLKLEGNMNHKQLEIHLPFW